MMLKTLEKVVGSALTVASEFRELRGHIRDLNTSKPQKKQVTTPQIDEVFSVYNDDRMFYCEECFGYKFRFLNKIKMKCLDCGIVYNIEYSQVGWEVLYLLPK